MTLANTGSLWQSEMQRRLWADPHPVPPWEWRKMKCRWRRAGPDALLTRAQVGNDVRPPCDKFPLSTQIPTSEVFPLSLSLAVMSAILSPAETRSSVYTNGEQ
jgi:hypothetical protein